MMLKWMKSRKGVFAVLIVLALSTTLYFACDDKGLDPEFLATVSGEITFTTKVPDFTDIIVLALMKGLNPVSLYTLPSNALDDTAKTQKISFQMETALGEYDGIFAIWKAHHEAIKVEANIVGSYCENGALIPISVTKENSAITGINFDVSLKKVNRFATVKGVINFKGDWPADIENLGIVFADPSTLLGGLNICTLLNSVDIQLVENPRTPRSSMPFEFNVVPGPTLMIVAWNRVGQSLFQPTIISDLGADAFFMTTCAGDSIAPGYANCDSDTIKGLIKENFIITADFGTGQ